MSTITTMQKNRFEHNRLDSVRKISVSEFYERGFEKLKPFETNYDLHYDEENGGVFVKSQRCNQYFLIGKKIK
jgi:hypothetical protein